MHANCMELSIASKLKRSPPPNEYSREEKVLVRKEREREKRKSADREALQWGHHNFGRSQFIFSTWECW